MRKRTEVSIVAFIFIVGLLTIGVIGYEKGFDEGFNANKQTNDQQILNILVRHNLGKGWGSALGSLKEAELLQQVCDGKIYVSAYTDYGSVGVTASTKSDTIVLRGVFEETFTPTWTDSVNNYNIGESNISR